MKQAHRMSAIVNAVVISTKDLNSGNLKAARSRIIDRVFTHTDGKLTGTSLSVDNVKKPVTFNHKLKVWEY